MKSLLFCIVFAACVECSLFNNFLRKKDDQKNIQKAIQQKNGLRERFMKKSSDETDLQEVFAGALLEKKPAKEQLKAFRKLEAKEALHVLNRIDPKTSQHWLMNTVDKDGLSTLFKEGVKQRTAFEDHVSLGRTLGVIVKALTDAKNLSGFFEEAKFDGPSLVWFFQNVDFDSWNTRHIIAGELPDVRILMDFMAGHPKMSPSWQKALEKRKSDDLVKAACSHNLHSLAEWANIYYPFERENTGSSLPAYLKAFFKSKTFSKLQSNDEIDIGLISKKILVALPLNAGDDSEEWSRITLNDTKVTETKEFRQVQLLAGKVKSLRWDDIGWKEMQGCTILATYQAWLAAPDHATRVKLMYKVSSRFFASMAKIFIQPDQVYPKGLMSDSRQETCAAYWSVLGKHIAESLKCLTPPKNEPSKERAEQPMDIIYAYYAEENTEEIVELLRGSSRSLSDTSKRSRSCSDLDGEDYTSQELIIKTTKENPSGHTAT